MIQTFSEAASPPFTVSFNDMQVRIALSFLLCIAFWDNSMHQQTQNTLKISSIVCMLTDLSILDFDIFSSVFQSNTNLETA